MEKLIKRTITWAKRYLSETMCRCLIRPTWASIDALATLLKYAMHVAQEAYTVTQVVLAPITAVVTATPPITTSRATDST